MFRVGFVCESDGSQVWLPLVSVDKTVAPWVLQRLSDLLPSTASTETKMEECQRLADQAAQTDSKLKQATASKVCLGRKSQVHTDTCVQNPYDRLNYSGRKRYRRSSSRDCLRESISKLSSILWNCWNVSWTGPSTHWWVHSHGST